MVRIFNLHRFVRGGKRGLGIIIVISDLITGLIPYLKKSSLIIISPVQGLTLLVIHGHRKAVRVIDISCKYSIWLYYTNSLVMFIVFKPETPACIIDHCSEIVYTIIFIMRNSTFWIGLGCQASHCIILILPLMIPGIPNAKHLAPAVVKREGSYVALRISN